MTGVLRMCRVMVVAVTAECLVEGAEQTGAVRVQVAAVILRHGPATRVCGTSLHVLNAASNNADAFLPSLHDHAL